MTTKNNIPAGYKDSAVGIIPQEWEVKPVKDFGQVVTGNTPSTVEVSNYGDEYMFVSPADLSDDKKYIFRTEKMLSSKGYAVSRKMPKGAILYTCIGSTIGKIGIASCELTSNQQINAVICDDNNEYLYYGLLFLTGRIKMLAGEQAVPIINKSDFERIKLAVPPMEEQRKIAEILGVWDEAIEKQSRLIEKLELRKRALMQRLLTGRTRLPGFTTPWQKVKLGEIGRFISGCVFNENEQGGKVGVPFFKVSDMNLCGNEVRMTKSNNYVTQEQIERLNYIVVKDEAIIFAKVGAAIALERKRYAKDFIIDNNMLAYVPDTNIWYMKYWFDSIKLSKYIQVGALPSYNASDLAIIKLNLPSLSEQKAIAEVLTTADKEIATHRKKLDVLRLQKRGLMQQLLTGKTRVKN